MIKVNFLLPVMTVRNGAQQHVIHLSLNGSKMQLHSHTMLPQKKLIKPSVALLGTKLVEMLWLPKNYAISLTLDTDT